MTDLYRAVLGWLALLICCAVPQLALAEAVNDFHLQDSENGRVLTFRDADIAPGTGPAIPDQGWTRQRLGIAWPPPLHSDAADPFGAVWARLRIDRANLPQGRLAIYTIDSRERLLIYLNGVDIGSNFAEDDHLALSGGRPMLVWVPQQLLRSGINEIAIRAQRTKRSEVGFGKIAIGSAAALERELRYQQFWRGSVLVASCYAMLALGFLVLVLWYFRREEPELLFLALSGIFWFARNYQFLADRAFEPFVVYQMASDAAVFLAVGSMLCYCVLNLQLTNRVFVVKLCVFIGVSTAIAFAALSGHAMAQALIIGLGNLCIGLIGYLIVRGWNKSSERRIWPALLVIGVMISFAVHDMGRIPSFGWWTGLGFLILPFAGVVLFFAFLLGSGKRLISALGAVEKANVELEANIARVRADLAASEEARKRSEIARAIESERTRLMREMHDGVGSNLITALAIAENQRHPPESIATLRRTLADLKLTVDSLEPIDGDVVTLLANFRHRLNPDLEDAGIACQWSISDCPPLVWLDPVCALDLLRTIQEAVGNVLSHSGADTISIRCQPAPMAGRAGILLEIGDNGRGFELGNADTGSTGRGLASMRSRIERLGGAFSIASLAGSGTDIEIWLPIDKVDGPGPAE